MKIVCVDDETLILQLTVSQCESLPGKPSVTGFQYAEEALAYVEANPVDIALLDIDMPDMNGLLLAAKMKEACPEVSVIFLTGFSEYAVDAFAIHASGYLLKPVSKERLIEEIAYALANRPQRPKEHIFVQTFGNFDIFVDGKAISFPRGKAKELLAALVDRQGSSITRAEAFAILWEQGLYDRSKQKQLDVIIRSLRDTLQKNGIAEIFEMSSGNLRICPEKFVCDLYRFFEGDMEAVNTYRGEYMSSYSWASITEAYMEQQKSSNA